MDKEFEIGDTVTLDRYNHIDDVEKVKVIGYGEMPISKTLTYKMRVNGITIESTGGSIVESKHYDPVPKEERHAKKYKIATSSKRKIYCIVSTFLK